MARRYPHEKYSWFAQSHPIKKSPYKKKFQHNLNTISHPGHARCKKKKCRVRAYFVPALCSGRWLELPDFPPPLSTDNGHLP